MANEVRRYAEGEPLPEGICPVCRSARPPRGRELCQACAVVAEVSREIARINALLGWPQ